MYKIFLGASALLLVNALQASTLSKKIQESSLVVYNSGIGLVHEERGLSLKKSDKFITYRGVASSINTDSVNINIDPSVSLLSQQYRYDKLTQAKLLEAHIGKKIEVRMLKNRNEFKIIAATLLSHTGSLSIVRTLDYKIITVKSSDIRFDEIPEELLTKPSLVWNINATQDLQTTMKIDYLINSISFKSDYILNIDANSAQLSGWITLNNRSGKTFKDTKLLLLAGDINRASHTRVNYKEVRAMRTAVASPEVQQRSHEGYHIYEIPFRVNLANNEKTQIKFLSKKNLPITREYTATLYNPRYVRAEKRFNVTQYIKLAKLDTPLPQGIVRTYSKSMHQTLLLAETNIAHTPKNRPIKLRIGTNFDLKVKQTILNRSDRDNFYIANIEYSIQNSSDEQKEVKLRIPFNRERSSQIKSELDYTFTEGNFVTFIVKVLPNATEKFKVHFESKK